MACVLMYSIWLIIYTHEDDDGEDGYDDGDDDDITITTFWNEKD